MPSEACPRCGQSFERDDVDAAENAVVAHMTSKIDDDHEGIGYKKALRMLEFGPSHEGDSEEEISEEETQISEPSDISQRASTDGGRQTPPMPDVDETDEQENAGYVTVDDLPERYVPVEDYVERKRRRDDVDADTLAAHLEDYDVVDVESFTGESIEAYTIDEVIDGE
jgi:hypothetical protein